jgi:nicotinate-nucleotide adenylyltransferase
MVNQVEQHHTSLLHARTGAALAFDIYGESREAAQAIEAHTTGLPVMSDLAKILFLSDKLEPTRDYPSVERLRRLAFEDLNKAMLAAYDDAIIGLLKKGCVINPSVLEARNGMMM